GGKLGRPMVGGLSISIQARTPNHASLRTDGRTMGCYRIAVARTRGRSGGARRGQSVVCERHHLGRPHGGAVARSARAIRRMELGLSTLQSLVEIGCVGTRVSIAEV